MNSSTQLITSVNHVAIVTGDIDRFIDFYTSILGLDLVFRESAMGLRHAILRSGPQSWLHPVQVVGSGGCGVASDKTFERGHLDHIGLTAASPRSFAELRRRLVACGASDGSVEDLGAFQAIGFSDPDGMRVELALIIDPTLRSFHAPVRHGDGDKPLLSVERLTSREHLASVDELLREYVPWVADFMTTEYGVHFVDAAVERHHAEFYAEMDRILGARGRLLLAHLEGEPVGVVALKPVDDSVAEVKRMYMRPSARGHGIGKALIGRVIADARREGYRRVRLETLDFMTEAIALYRASGFVDAPAFEHPELEMVGLASAARYMELTLLQPGTSSVAVKPTPASGKSTSASPS